MRNLRTTDSPTHSNGKRANGNSPQNKRNRKGQNQNGASAYRNGEQQQTAESAAPPAAAAAEANQSDWRFDPETGE
jgi:hypothetical protein